MTKIEKSQNMVLHWSSFSKYVQQAVNSIEHKKYDRVLAVSRGGLAVAPVVCHILGISNVVSIQVKTYGADRAKLQSPTDCCVRPDTPIRGYTGPETLVVDDICDTGDTFRMIKMLYPNASYLSVISTYIGRPECDFVGNVIPNNVWIVFPWEELTA